MGLLSTKEELNETDKRNGHRRVYNIESIKTDFEKSGFRIVQLGGYWLKPLSNLQINLIWNPEMIIAFLILGEKYPEIAVEIYIIAENK